MNPFDELIEKVKRGHDELKIPLLHIPVGDYILDTSNLLTDDLAVIFEHFIKDKEMIKSLVEYCERLPYSIKIDLMYYLGMNKKIFKKLKKIKEFDEFVDGFAASIADIKLQ